MNPRPYQLAAVERIFEEFEMHASTLLVLPTGVGKTVVFSLVAKRHIAKAGTRIMVLAHREELIRQAAAKLAAITGEQPEIEMAGERADLHFFRRVPIVVSSIQTLNAQGGKRLQRFNPRDFGLVITDEAHHAVAESYRRVYDHFLSNPACRHLGVTATPDRTDEEALGQVFKSVAFNYEILDAVNDGWLVPVSQRFVNVKDLDFRNVHTLAGDFNQKELAGLMEYESVLHGIADATLAIARWRHVLVFAASVAAAERMAEIFNRHRPNCARWVSGETPKDERRQVLADFNARTFQFLVNVGVFTEGFDEPQIDLVVMARPTKSRSLYAQMIGRGTRPLPGIVDGLEDNAARTDAIAASEKPSLEVLDFVGNSGQHKLVTAIDILAGNHSDRVVQTAIEEAKKAGRAVSVAEVVAEADGIEQRKREAEREAERQRRAKLTAAAKFDSKTVDPFDVMDIDPPVQHGWDLSHQPTDKQRELLARYGVPIPANATRAVAGALITEVFARRDQGRCTFKQAKLLKKYGYPTNTSFTDAKGIIDAIKANGWKRPVEATA